MMEAEIRTIPEGSYEGQATVYYDGKIPGSTYTIRVRITVGDGRIRFDYSDTDPQTPGFVNGTYTSSASATILTFLQMVNPDIPAQRGHGGADRDHHPGGDDPERRLPRGDDLRQSPLPAERRRHHPRPGAGDPRADHGRLEPAAVRADDRRGPPQGEKFVDIGFMGLKGGSGAMRGTDGYDHIGMIDASGGVLDQDYEMFEQQTPHRLVKHEYLTDSAGPGQWRGGLGVETRFVIGSDDTTVVTFGDGDVEPAFGLWAEGRGV